MDGGGLVGKDAKMISNTALHITLLSYSNKPLINERSLVLNRSFGSSTNAAVIILRNRRFPLEVSKPGKFD